MVGQSRPDIRIGGVEFTDHRADRSVLGDGEGGEVEIGGGHGDLPMGETKSDVIESIGRELLNLRATGKCVPSKS